MTAPGEARATAGARPRPPGPALVCPCGGETLLRDMTGPPGARVLDCGRCGARLVDQRRR